MCQTWLLNKDQQLKVYEKQCDKYFKRHVEKSQVVEQLEIDIEKLESNLNEKFEK